MIPSAPRSFLFVPADHEKKIERAISSAADVVVLDLEDTVTEVRRDIARQMARETLDLRVDRTQKLIWVRVNSLDTDLALKDLATVVGGKPDGIVLPKCVSGAYVTRLDHYLTALEAREDIESGTIEILPIATETPASVFKLGTYALTSHRLHGLTWGAEDLSSALGAFGSKNEDGTYPHFNEVARSLCLIGARAANVRAIEAAYTNFRDLQGLKSSVNKARREGFTGMIAIHPDQVELINAGFLPDKSEVERARNIVNAFHEAGHEGAIQYQGTMLEKPHLTQALMVLRMMEANDTKTSE